MLEPPLRGTFDFSKCSTSMSEPPLLLYGKRKISMVLSLPGGNRRAQTTEQEETDYPRKFSCAVPFER